MKIGLAYRPDIEAISPLLASDLDRVLAAIRAWSRREHNGNGTHGTITADRLLLDSGTSAVPSLVWAVDPDTGWYRDSTSGGWFLVYNGSPLLQILSGQVRLEAGGSAATPLLVFIGSETTGWYRFNSTTWGFSANGNQVLSLSTTGLNIIGTLQCDTITNDTGLAAGVYTPTLTNVANLDASTAYECQYLRVGNTVTVSGKVDVDPTLTVTSTQLGISLPVASNLGAAEDCAGTAFASAIAGQGAAILGDAANNRAQMQWISGDVTNQPMYFTFSYQVI